jgi:ABC-type iron transport system FetAB ATPase subunit
MATKKKTAQRPEVHITITGPQGCGKTQLAESIAAFIGGTVNYGDIVRQYEAVGNGTAVCRALQFIASRQPYQAQSPKIIIATSNE